MKEFTRIQFDLDRCRQELALFRALLDSKADLEAFMAANRGGMSEDRDGAPVFLARNAWELGYVAERSPAIKFADIRERA